MSDDYLDYDGEWPPMPNVRPGASSYGMSPATGTTPPTMPPLEPASPKEAAIIERLKEVVDPELGINVVDLGLVYGVTVNDQNDITLDMTLTTPACPLTDQIEWEAQAALSEISKSVTFNWVWLPPWSLDRITEDGREQLRYIGYYV